nr:uncharacterized protein LOC113840025 [Anas platyrhynchos]XP_027301535.2 uncharacterized protein LOC113840025 [Anas platyrhynchos]XP_027301536.2 uncharacterized protein LOC113840025 [Anas platyrhynchos]XP_038024815.1 uncharacterized protein LOC113840025 [Anas platyrhynchos]XP_038024816.1 uncharacterized protein LOC113840025 [Anas platyrhynchos]
MAPSWPGQDTPVTPITPRKLWGCDVTKAFSGAISAGERAQERPRVLPSKPHTHLGCDQMPFKTRRIQSCSQILISGACSLHFGVQCELPRSFPAFLVPAVCLKTPHEAASVSQHRLRAGPPADGWPRQPEAASCVLKIHQNPRYEGQQISYTINNGVRSHIDPDRAQNLFWELVRAAHRAGISLPRGHGSVRVGRARGCLSRSCSAPFTSPTASAPAVRCSCPAFGAPWEISGSFWQVLGIWEHCHQWGLPAAARPGPRVVAGGLQIKHLSCTRQSVPAVFLHSCCIFVFLLYFGVPKASVTFLCPRVRDQQQHWNIFTAVNVLHGRRAPAVCGSRSSPSDRVFLLSRSRNHLQWPPAGLPRHQRGNWAFPVHLAPSASAGGKTAHPIWSHK